MEITYGTPINLVFGTGDIYEVDMHTESQNGRRAVVMTLQDHQEDKGGLAILELSPEQAALLGDCLLGLSVARIGAPA